MSAPFSNGTEWDIWSARWCNRCSWDAEFQATGSGSGCDLLLTALSGDTPVEWTPVGLGNYSCSSFEAAVCRATTDKD